eukprot:150370-Pyramimonas_sp.AAC.1
MSNAFASGTCESMGTSVAMHGGPRCYSLSSAMPKFCDPASGEWLSLCGAAETRMNDGWPLHRRRVSCRVLEADCGMGARASESGPKR